MARRARPKRRFTVVVASDGSAPARAALATAAAVCWPAHARLHAVTVREPGLELGGPGAAELEAAVQEMGEQALDALSRSGRPATLAVMGGAVGPSILAQARRERARVIVVGSRGHGPLRRMVLGSTSRFLVREAPCAVLVVRERPARGQRIVLGIDGSPQSRRAAALLAELEPPSGARVRVVAAVEPLSLPSLGQLPAGVRASLRAQASAMAEERRRKAQRMAETACRRLEAAGWSARIDVSEGLPLDTLLARVGAERADLLAIGARGVGGARRWLLGSVAEGALQHAPCAVLLAR